jgi:hypothetical protein
MVWHDCLLTVNDEHLFTGAAWGLCKGVLHAKFVSKKTTDATENNLMPNEPKVQVSDTTKMP